MKIKLDGERAKMYIELEQKPSEHDVQNKKSLAHPYGNVLMHTCDTMVWVCSVPQCAEIHYHTCTCTTHFGKLTGFPIPMLNLTLKVSTLYRDTECLHINI